MKGHIEVIEHLKKILTNELTAINQYFLHSRMCKDWGYEKLAEAMYQESVGEMKHAKDIIDRILFLEGQPNLQNLHPLKVGVTVKKQLENDLNLEYNAVKDLKKAIQLAQTHSDFSSKELLETILVTEEEHVDWIEAQLNIINEIGEGNYLSQQIHSK
ncbi:MAG: bacterioferritin [Bdellovibrionales bacterium]|nr:bacterioferritin [Bdellovibrionales bacterium]